MTRFDPEDALGADPDRRAARSPWATTDVDVKVAEVTDAGGASA